MDLLQVEQLGVTFNHSFKALNQVSFNLRQGEVLGIVGESGSGKSTLARVIMRLQMPSEGDVKWRSDSLFAMDNKQQQAYRKQVQMIFQDPLDALNPRMTVAQIIAEPLRYLMPQLSRKQVRQKVAQVLTPMGLSESQLGRYPHEFSGGQCQRIGIARAMIVEPELLVCDEPVSALDVSIQAQIINLLLELKQQKGLSMLFISHDLSIVRHLCDRVLVLYKGEIVELAETESLYQSPQSDYTRRLLASIPLHNPLEERARIEAWGV